MPPRSISPASAADQDAEHQREEPEPDSAATPPTPPPPPQGHLRHTSRHPGPHGRRAVLPVHPTRPPGGPRDPPGVKQEKRNDNEWGTEEDLLLEDTWKGTMGAFLEAAAETYPRPPGDTRHGLHALLAFHSWKHRHTITLHPLDHNPH